METIVWDDRTYNIRSVHVRFKMRESNVNWCIPDDVSGLTDKQRLMVKAIAAINGVESVITDKYSIRITKGTAFSWNEIESLVERQIELYQQSV